MDGYSYEKTLFFGRFRNEFRAAARAAAETAPASTERSPPEFRSSKKSQSCWRCPLPDKLRSVLASFGDDWLFLATLGVTMAVLSWAMDKGIDALQTGHQELYLVGEREHWVLAYLLWTVYTCVLVTGCSALVNALAPQASGSGIPEMKTILRGVVLKEYLTWRTLVAKMIGLTVSLGSGLPIGKEGPFVHIASIAATLLSSCIGKLRGSGQNESRNHEMLSTACAVGVACTFGAPVGGVLFSIEVTAVYFAVRNYWRGFFAALCSAIVFKTLRLSLHETYTFQAHYHTTLAKYNTRPYVLPELIVFALLGAVLGVAGALFVHTHRNFVHFVRSNRILKYLMTKSVLIYPALVALLTASVTFPGAFGQFIGGDLSFGACLKDFFSNQSLIALSEQIELNMTEPGPDWVQLVDRWTAHGQTNVFCTLALFSVTYFFLAALSNALPIPAGVFIPSFVIGASFGRLIGESMVALLPDGLGDHMIVPGVYAVVGGAAFTGAVTHTISVCVIVFELTGELDYAIPIMAVLIANIVCGCLQPSIYDSIIEIKHLPYLPNIPASQTGAHTVHVEDLMVRQVKYVSRDSTYSQLQDMLLHTKRHRVYPVVDSNQRCVLLGSVSKRALWDLLEHWVGSTARVAEAQHRQQQPTNNNTFVPSAVPTLVDTDTPSNELSTPSTSTAMAMGTKRKRFTVTAVQDQESEPVSADDTAAQNIAKLSAHVEAQYPHSVTHSASYSRLNQFSVNVGSAFRTLVHRFTVHNVNAQNTHDTIDLYGQERADWEQSRLRERVHLGKLQIDPSPFQLVERTSLYKAHSLFSLLGLNRAYVTNCGRLVGVVALKEVREAVQCVSRGEPVHAGVEDLTPVQYNGTVLDRTHSTDPEHNMLGLTQSCTVDDTQAARIHLLLNDVPMNTTVDTTATLI